MRTLGLTAGLVLLLVAVAVAQALPVFDTSRLYLTEAEFTRAIQPYQQAITADARNARAHYWLGFAYLYAWRQIQFGIAPYAAGYLPRAVASLSEAIRLDPGMLLAYLSLQDAYVFLGDHQKADATVEQMLAKTRPTLGPLTIK